MVNKLQADGTLICFVQTLVNIFDKTEDLLSRINDGNLKQDLTDYVISSIDVAM